VLAGLFFRKNRQYGNGGQSRCAFMDSRPDLGLPSDQGISIVTEQNLGEKYQAFACYTLNDAVQSFDAGYFPDAILRDSAKRHAW
jgi:hypothetical protein